MATKTVYRGVFPVAPTVFDGSGELDLEGQKRAIVGGVVGAVWAGGREVTGGAAAGGGAACG